MTGEPVPRPMTMEERVEAAANALDVFSVPGPPITTRELTREILHAFAPELFNGTGWIAPMEATEEMLAVLRPWTTSWTAARQAYLKEGK